MNGFGFIFGLMCFVMILTPFGFGIYKCTTVDYQFNNAVHSHMENAYYSSDPSTMRTELNETVNGMRQLGLTDNLYGALFPWDRTPDHQMKWQYQHIASIQTRVDEWEKWEKSNAGSQQMQDVNSQKLDNVRHFIKGDGWSDDIASMAYFCNFYMWLVYGMVLPLLILLFVYLAILFAGMD